MIPNGSELTCTLMFEIDDPKVRARILGALGGVEDHIFLSINGEKIAATPEGDVERSTPEGKASSVHFLHFPFADAQIQTWKSGEGQAMFHIDHPRSEEHTSELQSLMRISYAVFCLKNKQRHKH